LRCRLDLAETLPQVAMLRTLPLDTVWRRAAISPGELAGVHLMCEQSWGEEFRPRLAAVGVGSGVPAGQRAARECAAMNVSTAHRLALECWRHCPPAMVAPGGGPDATDQLGPPPDSGGGRCGRHCGKMLRVWAAVERGPGEVDPVLIAMMEPPELSTGSGRHGPCVMLEGNHRLVPWYHAHLLRAARAKSAGGGGPAVAAEVAESMEAAAAQLGGGASVGRRALPELTVYVAVSPRMAESTFFRGVKLGLLPPPPPHTRTPAAGR
jgi:hypothetical protein